MNDPGSTPVPMPADDESRLSEVFLETIPLGLVFLDGQGRIMRANPAACRILGVQPGEVCGMLSADPCWGQVRADGSPFPVSEQPSLIALHGGKTVENTVMGITNQRSRRRHWLSINAVPLFRPGESLPSQVYLTFDDITASKRAEDRDKARNRTLELVARGAVLPDILHAIVREVEGEDPAMICTILLLDRSGKHLLHGAAPSMPEFFNQAVDGIAIGVGVGSCGTAAATGRRVVVEDIAHHPYWAPYTDLAAAAGLGACWSEPIRSSRGHLLGTFAIYHREPSVPSLDDLLLIENTANLAAVAIEHAQVLEDLEKQARTDYLTGLANRRHFWEQAEAEVARSLRYHNPLSLLMLDVDHFKRINDNWGHKVGDQVLKSLADACLAGLRDADLAGRLGGEEFGVLLPETTGERAMDVAERLRQAMADSKVRLEGGQEIGYTVSFGVSTLNRDVHSLETMFSLADHALYDAKHAGRNRVCTAPGVLTPPSEE